MTSGESTIHQTAVLTQGGGGGQFFSQFFSQKMYENEDAFLLILTMLPVLIFAPSLNFILQKNKV